VTSYTPTLVRALIAATLCAQFGACSVSEGTIGTMSAPGFVLDGCLEGESLDASLNALAIDACSNLLYVRAQDAKTPLATANGIQFQFPDPDSLKDQLEAGPVDLDVASGQVVLSLFLNRSCPDSYAPLEALSGTVTVTAITDVTGGNVQLSGDVVIHDTRTGDVVAPSLVFEIDAADSSYRPMRDYPICP
jgi:hypothetical protein